MPPTNEWATEHPRSGKKQLSGIRLFEKCMKRERERKMKTNKFKGAAAATYTHHHICMRHQQAGRQASRINWSNIFLLLKHITEENLFSNEWERERERKRENVGYCLKNKRWKQSWAWKKDYMWRLQGNSEWVSERGNI
jgi:hypothetical protein